LGHPVVSVQLQGRPNALPATQNTSQKSSGDKNNRGGAKFTWKINVLMYTLKMLLVTYIPKFPGVIPYPGPTLKRRGT